MKRVSKILLGLLLISAPAVVSAAQEGPYTYTVANGQATITAFSSSYSGTLFITNTLGGYPVTTFGDYAFAFRNYLTTVTIPDGVTNIGSKAFYYCTSLTNATLPDSVTTIGNTVFSSCTNLNAVTLGSGIISIGEFTFADCINLTSVTMGPAVTSIGSGAFDNCSSLTNITISDNVNEIWNGAFAYCTSLTNINIGRNVNVIGDNVFYKCTNLSTITVDDGNVSYSSLDGILFNETQSILIQCPARKTGYYSIPERVTEIGPWAFSDCNELTNISVPGTVTLINYEAFAHCQKLANISIPDSVISIEAGAFYDCGNLTAVTIPGSVAVIWGGAFLDCHNLQRVFFAGYAPLTPDPRVFDSAPATIYYLPAYASSWPATFAGRPTKLWNPAFSETAFTADQISCTVTGSPPIPIAFETTTNLTTGPWLRLHTTNLTSESLVLHDMDSTNHPARFYRIIGP